jgi:hypothetical protein
MQYKYRRNPCEQEKKYVVGLSEHSNWSRALIFQAKPSEWLQNSTPSLDWRR